MALVKKIKDLLQGNFSKRTLTHYYMPFTLGLMVLFLLLARIFYPYIEENPYQWYTSMISRLGWPEENPIGFLFFSIAFFLFGFFMFPLIPYTYKKFSQIDKFKANLVAGCMLTFCTTIALIGLLPNYIYPPICRQIHLFNMMVGFLSFFLMAIIAASIMLKENQSQGKENPRFSKKLLTFYIIFLLYGLICILLAIFLVPPGVGERYIYDPSVPVYLAPPIWEWQAFIAVITLLLIHCFILPENVERQ